MQYIHTLHVYIHLETHLRGPVVMRHSQQVPIWRGDPEDYTPILLVCGGVNKGHPRIEGSPLPSSAVLQADGQEESLATTTSRCM